jgi:hypothetical protein
MEKTISKNTLKLRKSSRIYTVYDFREEYQQLKDKISASGKSEISLLVTTDAYFDSVKGITDYKNVQSGKAGLVATANVVNTLKKSLKKLKL